MRNGLASLCLMMSLTACAPKALVFPPAALMAPCEETRVPIRVNGDLVYKIISLRGDLARCNADKQGLRSWAKDMGK